MISTVHVCLSLSFSFSVNASTSIEIEHCVELSFRVKIVCVLKRFDFPTLAGEGFGTICSGSGVRGGGVCSWQGEDPAN